MSKTSTKILLSLPEPLREAIKRAAEEEHLSESAFIREAIRLRLRNPPDDLYWLQSEKKDFELSSTDQILLRMVAQILSFEDARATPEERKIATDNAKKIIATFLEKERSKS